MSLLRHKVFAVLERLAPLHLAEKWDNVGVLINSLSEVEMKPLVVFLTNDLTEKVLDEAVDKKANVVVSYHPTPFRAFKRLTTSDPASRIVLTCVSKGICVYSPHTAFDNVADGLNDWLASGLGDGTVAPIVPHPDVPGAGNGRIITFSAPRRLSDVIAAAKSHLGLAHVRVALPSSALPGAGGASNAAAVANAASDCYVQTVAVCAGSGSSVLGGVQADVYLTGEMSHHEVLAATHANVSVILTDHSNTERGFLPVLAQRLLNGLSEDGVPNGEVEVVVSELDSDPLNVM